MSPDEGRRQKPRQIACFDAFEFDLGIRELRKHGTRLQLEAKPALVLEKLIEQAGRAVTRDELEQALWPSGVYVDFEHGLNKSVNRLRAVLGDDREQPRYIETLSRRGYRFVADVRILVEPSAIEDVQRSIGRQPLGRGEQLTPPDPGNAIQDVTPSLPNDKTGEQLSIFSPNRSFPWKRLLPIAAIITIGLVWAAVRAARSSGSHVMSRVISLPSQIQLSSSSANLGLALSPDGAKVVFSAVGPDRRLRLWLSAVNSTEPEPIAGSEGGAFPFWSPDGNELAFFSFSELKRVNLRNNSIKTICAVDAGRGGTWSKNGVILFSKGVSSPIYRVDSKGGIPVAVTALDESHFSTHRWPSFFPDGEHFVYFAAMHNATQPPGAIFIGSLAGEKERLLGEADSNAIPSSGSLLFLSHGKLISQSVDVEKGSLDSHADIIANAVDYDSGIWYGSFTANPTTIIYRQRQATPNTRTLVWFDRSGKRVGEAGPPGTYREMSLAPDDQTIAATCGEPATNICLINADNTVTELTRDGINGWPAWASDSSFVSFYTYAGRSFSIVIKDLSAKVPPRTAVTASDSVVISSWHPDKSHALLLNDLEDGRHQYRIFDLFSRSVRPYLSVETGPNEFPRFSPNGHWVAYSKPSAGVNQIHVVSYPNPSRDYLVATSEGRGPRWRADGSELYFLGSKNTLNSVTISTKETTLQFGVPKRMFELPISPAAPWDLGSFEVTRDGKRVLVLKTQPVQTSQLVLTNNPH